MVLPMAEDRWLRTVPSDSITCLAMSATDARVGERLAKGMNITEATREGDAESNMMADRDEDFNTRYASFRGWQMAIQRVKPIPRRTAQVELAALVRAQKLSSTGQVVDYFARRFLRVPLEADQRDRLVGFLDTELGTSQIAVAETYMEDALRMLLHLIMSMPEYQLG